MRIGGVNYTLGVLVQSNFGATEDLVIDGIRAGQRILEEKERRRTVSYTHLDVYKRQYPDRRGKGSGIYGGTRCGEGA